MDKDHIILGIFYCLQKMCSLIFVVKVVWRAFVGSYGYLIGTLMASEGQA